MATLNFDERDTAEHSVGRVFTPLEWAEWLIEAGGVYDVWLAGGRIIDPTCGDGRFLEAFPSLAMKRGDRVTAKMLKQLFGIELVPGDKRSFLERMERKFSVSFPEDNVRTADFILMDDALKCDALAGNPPWINYVDIPRPLQERWRNRFVELDLVNDRKKALLGGSRVDLASLVIKKALDRHLMPGGRAAFFLPLSVFFNDGANDRFRPFPRSGHSYAVRHVWDFGNDNIFNGIRTRFGAAVFVSGREQKWPVRAQVRVQEKWENFSVQASDRKSGPWVRHESEAGARDFRIPSIEIREGQMPRQGVNTCGANHLFIFERAGDESARGVWINGEGRTVNLDERVLFPLVGREQFGHARGRRQKWVLILHDRKSGKPMAMEEIQKYEGAVKYLECRESVLRARKGVLINSHIKRGRWWALLGVGRYSFAPWKVVWESLGQKEFKPIVVEGRWQGNQALHAFCPCESRGEAENLRAALSDESVKEWLSKSGMEGTCNWAQPGRIRRIMREHLCVEQESLL
ncbi:MAG: SAM-dependent methyltransferase [Alphaproteobacteria bacterium]|nr:SAM-dependent methyltransferase [Alphaproteobacteria bacterium]MDA8004439.1 SAM-dependent methyltransferase [Alphaproteobacteria bacterium]MDA8005350.1 SAM-dependent methyltransferase [Alphaproteobacteria bacterium]MDA8012953.1 SAM-dependent methyltransferase [Alphaproteobacteria bacterium]